MARTSKAVETKTEPINDIEARKKAVLESVNQIEKKYGKGAVIKLGDKPKAYPHLSTGILSLDVAIGIGGLPKGRIIEIYGPESAGKTLIALQAVAATQKAGGLCAFIDAEHSLNVQFAENIGVNVDDLFVCQPDDGETAMDIAEQLIRSGGISLIVIDSVAALTPRAEIEGEMTDQQMGLQARLLSKALRKINGVVSKTDTTVIFINQLREKIGIMFGSPETTTGGRALKFYSSVRLDVRKVDTIKQGGDITGNRVKVKVVKNKMAPPMKEAQFDLMFDSGASQTGALVDFGVELGIIEKSGSWFSYQDAKIGQGRENAKLYLEENPDVAQIIEQQIYEHYGIVDNKDIDPSVMEEAKARIKEETEQFDFDSDDM